MFTSFSFDDAKTQLTNNSLLPVKIQTAYAESKSDQIKVLRTELKTFKVSTTKHKHRGKFLIHLNDQNNENIMAILNLEALNTYAQENKTTVIFYKLNKRQRVEPPSTSEPDIEPSKPQDHAYASAMEQLDSKLSDLTGNDRTSFLIRLQSYILDFSCN